MGEQHDIDDETPIFAIAVAAELSGMHPQTLRQYDRLGLVKPGRAGGGGRRYSLRDIELLREVQRLSQEEGVNLAGIKRIIALEQEVDMLRAQIDELLTQLQRPSTALVVWQPQRLGHGVRDAAGRSRIKRAPQPFRVLVRLVHHDPPVHDEKRPTPRQVRPYRSQEHRDVQHRSLAQPGGNIDPIRPPSFFDNAVQ